MNRRFLQSVLRSLVDLGPPASDADLLRQFVASRSEAAFAELVHRHGRLVWTVCRHLTGSEADADDAFQATFVVLLQNARKIRQPARISSWLHGVAIRVARKARLAAQRRTARERASAMSEHSNGAVVADSAWDRALAAVHEEVATLPDNLRLPFVLCCLEGKSVTDAAAQLGWKLGACSARLQRAKDAVLAQLDIRGLTLGAVAGIGLALPPAALVAKTEALAALGSVVPSAILPLTQGVITMSLKSIKLMAASLVLTGGLVFSWGSGWLGTAEAQVAPSGSTPKQVVDSDTDAAQLKLDQARASLAAAQAHLEAQRTAGQNNTGGPNAAMADVDKARADVAAALAALAQQRSALETATVKTTKWEYDLVVVSDMGPSKFAAFLQDRENRGWEFNGQTTLQHDGKPTGMWVFRRPTQSTATPKSGTQPATTYSQAIAEYYRALGQLPPPAKPKEPNTIQAEIEALQERLHVLRAMQTKTGRTTFSKDALPLEPDEFAKMLTKMLQKTFPGRVATITSSSAGITVEGDDQVRQWVIDLLDKLKVKEPSR